MSNSNTPLNHLGQYINKINRANGWNVMTPEAWRDAYWIPANIALITSELSEALEAFRKNDFDNFKEEMADALIRILNVTDGLEIDMDVEVADKLEKNKTRGYRHGGKRV